MIRLLNAGKAEESVETYCAPADLEKMLKQGRTMEKLVARFADERRRKVLIDILGKVSKLPPLMSEDGDMASWETGMRPGTLRLQRIEGRWYLRN